MCRLLAFAAPVPRTARDVLGEEQLERFAKLSELHSHGWGAEWVETPGDAVRTKRQLRDLKGNEVWELLTRRQPAVALGLHLRWASGGAAVVPENNHPFTRNGIALMHNGTISPLPRLDTLVASDTLADIEGTTDTERYLGVIADRRRCFGDLASAVADGVALLGSAFPDASLNAVVLDGTELVVVQASTHAPPPLDDLRAQMQARRDLPHGHDTGYYRMYWRTNPDGTTLISSSGLDLAGWTTLPLDTITRFDLAEGTISQRRITHGREHHEHRTRVAGVTPVGRK